MFNIGQLVAVRRTGAYGIVDYVNGRTVQVVLDTGRTVRFDSSSLEVVPRGTKAGVLAR